MLDFSQLVESDYEKHSVIHNQNILKLLNIIKDSTSNHFISYFTPSVLMKRKMLIKKIELELKASIIFTEFDY